MSVPNIALDFGPVRISKNTNSVIEGKDNQGAVERNSNLSLLSIKYNLNLINNSNSIFNVEHLKKHGELDCVSNVNTVVTGKGNTAKLNYNSNSKFEGNDNFWKANSNTGSVVSGNQCTLTLLKNSDSIFEGNNNTIVAENNSQLVIEGNFNNANVRKTKNHTVKLAIGNSMEHSMNMLDINYPNESAGWLSSMFSYGSSKNDVKFIVNYMNKAEICESKYKLGIFDLNVSKLQNSYKINFDGAGVDRDSLQVTSTNSGEVVLSATQGKERQELKIKAPSIQPHDGEVMTFMVNARRSRI